MKRIIEQVLQLAKDLNSVPQILIVEDDPNDMELMARTLDKLGCQVFRATSVDSATAQLASRMDQNVVHPFDAVFLDLKLLGGDSGIEVLRRISQSAPSVPVVIVTGYPSSDQLHEAVRIGYFGLVQKPLEPEAVRQIFRKHKIEHHADHAPKVG